VAPYSLRATDRPTASVPLAWHEVEAAVARCDPSTLVFEARDVIGRVARRGDPLADIAASAAPIPTR
jgi:bifunctional non-homologous end joining protein LigD